MRMDKDLLNTLEETLQKILIFNLENYTAIPGGSSNKLFRLESTNGQQLLLKIYHNDTRQRLTREFSAIQFLNKQEFKQIPKAYLKNDQYNFGVYSYEQGGNKSDKDISVNDIKLVAEFIASIHMMKKSAITTTFLPAYMACLSLQDYVNNCLFRLDKYVEHVHSDDIHEKVQQFHQKTHAEQAIRELLNNTLKNFTEEQVNQPLSDEEQRLSPVDCGPHNMLFKDNGDIVFLDFEFFGWDDPMREIADFMNHDQTKNISQEKKKIFLETYLNRTEVTEDFVRRLEVVIRLVAIEWLTIHLYVMTPERIKNRQFAIKDFDVDSYLDEQIEKFNKKMSDLVA